MLYMYLASNANNYNLALSPAAIQEAIGMPRSTYRDQFAKLVRKGYLVQTGGNTFAFYEKPQPRVAQPAMDTETATGHDFEERTTSEHSYENATSAAPPMTDPVNTKAAWDREINNREIPDNDGINNVVIDIPIRKVCIPSPSAMDERVPKEKKKPFEDFEF